MIGQDTNVLVRYLVRDDPVQSRNATDLIEHRLTVDKSGFISVVAMVEAAWVLGHAYGVVDADIAATIQCVLQADVFVVEAEPRVFAAMTALKDGQAAFADALIAALGTRAGCAHTVAFDRGPRRLPGFEPL